jgi:hypothetical protein
MYAKSKLIEKQIISNKSYKALNHFFDFDVSVKKECHEVLRMQVIGGLSSSHTKLNSPKSGNDKCWFITSGMIIGIREYQEKEIVMLLFSAGELAILPETFFQHQQPSCTLIACPDTHFIEISRDTILKLQDLVPDPAAIISKMCCAPFKNFIEKLELASMPGIEAILEFHKRHPEVKGPGKKIDLPDNRQASYVGINEDTFCRLKKIISFSPKAFTQIAVALNFFCTAVAGTL